MIMFAFPGVDLALVVAITGIASAIAGAGVSIWSGYQANAASKTAAGQQRAAADAAAQSQRMAADAQARQLRDKAALAGLQAATEDKKAGVAQAQGEIEARRRSLQLASDIGNAYAQFAGNGLLVDGGDDSLGALLTAQTREAAQDVGIIRTNAANAVWEHGVNRTSALLTQKSLLTQAESASLAGEAGANATLLSGEAQAYATRQAGRTALLQGWGTGLSMLGSAAMAGYGAFKPTPGTAGLGGVNTTQSWTNETLYGGVGMRGIA